MPKELTQTDLVVLESYSIKGDRRRYWSYLAERGDPYAKLALGVVLNNTLAGQVANNFLWNKYQPNSAVVDERVLNEIGVKLMQADFRQRSSLFEQPNGAKFALELPAQNIYDEHAAALKSIDH